MSFKNPENQMARWLEILSQFDFKIEFRKGSKHVNADMLSRMPCNPEHCDCYDGNTRLENLPCGGCTGCKKKHEEWSILEDIDDVVPLISKRIRPETDVCYVNHFVQMWIFLVSFCRQKCKMLWRATFTMFIWLCMVLCTQKFSLQSDLFSTKRHRFRIGLCGPIRNFVRWVSVSCRGAGSGGGIHRLRAHDTTGTSSEDDVVLSDETLEKDFGIGTHSGGPYPDSSCDDNSETSEKVTYQFSNWVGSYTSEELAKLQMNDPDISSILSWRIKSADRPSRDVIAAESPAIRCLWLQWPQLFVKNGMLFRKCVVTNETKSYDQLVLPRILHREILQATHNSITSAHLGVKKTKERIKLNFYWYNMNQAVKLWINRCSFCGGRKRPAKKPKTPLQEYSVGYPLDRVATDITGPFPRVEFWK